MLSKYDGIPLPDVSLYFLGMKEASFIFAGPPDKASVYDGNPVPEDELEGCDPLGVPN
jgi:hypothetical protein